MLLQVLIIVIIFWRFVGGVPDMSVQVICLQYEHFAESALKRSSKTDNPQLLYIFSSFKYILRRCIDILYIYFFYNRELFPRSQFTQITKLKRV